MSIKDYCPPTSLFSCQMSVMDPVTQLLSLQGLQGNEILFEDTEVTIVYFVGVLDTPFLRRLRRNLKILLYTAQPEVAQINLQGSSGRIYSFHETRVLWITYSIPNAYLPCNCYVNMFEKLFMLKISFSLPNNTFHSWKRTFSSQKK